MVRILDFILEQKEGLSVGNKIAQEAVWRTYCRWLVPKARVPVMSLLQEFKETQGRTELQIKRMFRKKN